MESLPNDHALAPASAVMAGSVAPLAAGARPRVLQIVHARSAGGVQTLAESIADGLEARGFAVETEYLYPRDGASAAAKLAAVTKMTLRLLAGKHDALIAFQPTAAILVGSVGRLAGCRLRLVHQTTMPAELSPLQRSLDSLAGRLGLYTHNVANTGETLLQFNGYPAPYRRALLLIEHGVAVPAPSLGRHATLRRFGVPDDGPILLNVGRLTAQKNQGVLIHALPAIPRARLVIAGGGPQLDQASALAASLHVEKRVHFLGDVDREHIANLYAAADLFVFPSTWESFGLAPVEAAMCSLPMVASDLPVLREVLSEAGSEVAFVDCRDAAAWGPALAAALARVRGGRRPPPAVAQAMQARYGLPRMIEDYARLLSQALAKGE